MLVEVLFRDINYYFLTFILFSGHWLAIDRVQPSVPENLSSVSKNIEKIECLDPLGKLKKPVNVDVSRRFFTW